MLYRYLKVKLLLLALLFLFIIANGQKVALIDRKFKKPVLLTDTLIPELILQGWFPIYYDDLNNITASAELLVKQIDKQEIEKKGSQSTIIGHSQYVNNIVNNKYSITLGTQCNALQTFITLTKEDTNRRAIQKLSIFLDYLKNNSSVIESM